jgi:hypothetical protein
VPVTGSIRIGNTVVPVEVSNADPIPVSVTTSTPAVANFHRVLGLIAPAGGQDATVFNSIVNVSTIIVSSDSTNLGFVGLKANNNVNLLLQAKPGGGNEIVVLPAAVPVDTVILACDGGGVCSANITVVGTQSPP